MVDGNTKNTLEKIFSMKQILNNLIVERIRDVYTEIKVNLAVLHKLNQLDKEKVETVLEKK